MSADDLELAKRFFAALAVAAETGERELVAPYLAADVEWVTPQRVLHGIGDLRERMIWGSPPEKLSVDYEPTGLTDLGDGRVAIDVHEVYRMKDTGDFAYERNRSVEVTIRDGKVARYEMRVVG
jgi:ketosteroid isomerase-like protein